MNMGLFGVVIIVGFFFISNAAGEGGLKVIFSPKKDKGCRKVDIVISGALGITFLIIAYCMNTHLEKSHFLIGAVIGGILSYAGGIVYAKKYRPKD